MMKVGIFSKMLLIGVFSSLIVDILCVFPFTLNWIAAIIMIGFGLLFEGQCIALGFAWSDMETYRQKKGKVWQ